MRITTWLWRWTPPLAALVDSVQPRDTIWTPPGEWHWHGAAPEHFMTHLAMWEAPDDDSPETEWGTLVTDEEYRQR
jgi:hypothetical protein